MSSVMIPTQAKKPTGNNKLLAAGPGSTKRELNAELDQLDGTANFNRLPHVCGRPELCGVIRNEPADFQVSEVLPFEPSGSGEHLFVNVRKTAHNTRWVARGLAEKARLPLRAVGYAGLKDRHAVAEQWFSLHLPGRSDPLPADLESSGVEILGMVRHASKLRIGMVRLNRFRIVVRELQGSCGHFETRVERVRRNGVPNYFGPQRFGRGRGNISLLTGDAPVDRKSRSFGLSALRSALFKRLSGTAYLGRELAECAGRRDCLLAA